MEHAAARKSAAGGYINRIVGNSSVARVPILSFTAVRGELLSSFFASFFASFLARFGRFTGGSFKGLCLDLGRNCVQGKKRDGQDVQSALWDRPE